jgi:hypothetical protein
MRGGYPSAKNITRTNARYLLFAGSGLSAEARFVRAVGKAGQRCWAIAPNVGVGAPARP